MRIGKYITNFGILGALTGALGVRKQTKQMPGDWRRYILWLVWLLGVVLAVAAVAQDEENVN